MCGVAKSIHHFRRPKCTLFTPRPQISVFPGYRSRLKRNRRQRLRKILEGEQGENDELTGVFCKVALTKKEAGIETGGLK